MTEGARGGSGVRWSDLFGFPWVLGIFRHSKSVVKQFVMLHETPMIAIKAEEGDSTISRELAAGARPVNEQLLAAPPLEGARNVHLNPFVRPLLGHSGEMNGRGGIGGYGCRCRFGGGG